MRIEQRAESREQRIGSREQGEYTMNQIVKICLVNPDSVHNFRFNVYNQHEHEIHIDINDEGTIDLAVKFIKQSNGLFYCRIYQVYRYNKRELIYDEPIITTADTEGLVLTGEIIANEGYYNSEVDITDDEGNIIEQMEIVSLDEYCYVIAVCFSNQRKQREANQLYERYKRNKVEIDMFRELAAAYDKLQFRVIETEPVTPLISEEKEKEWVKLMEELGIEYDSK